ncbi:MAG: hypothetical protein N2506_05380 [Dehalococcoidales bacterium]|nr:hypothetical protein [Dehalococcoidales bacterium]
MNLAEMIALVRKDLRDDNSSGYRWSDAELARHINRAVREFSEAVPFQTRAVFPTAAGSRELDISSLSGMVMVEAVEYPLGLFPPGYRQFSVWGNTLTILNGAVPDGSDCCVYYGTLHTLDGSGSTVPPRYEELVVSGACGFAAVAGAIGAVNRINLGGGAVSRDYLQWGMQRLRDFRSEIRRLGRKNRVRVSSFYVPADLLTRGVDGGIAPGMRGTEGI